MGDLEALENNLVIHPKHYNADGRPECWEEMEEIFGKDAVVIFDVLSAYKYYYRAGKKDGNPEEQDKSKIDNYLRHARSIIDDASCESIYCYLKMLEVLHDCMEVSVK